MTLLMIDDLPEEIEQHLHVFLTQRPDWTQTRILQSALSLFLMQNGVNDRAVSRAYLQAMFGKQAQTQTQQAQGGVR